MDLKRLKEQIDNLSSPSSDEFLKSLQTILNDILTRLQKIEALESSLSILLENYVCANLEGLLAKENTRIVLECKRTRLKIKELNLEIDCFGAGKLENKYILIVTEVKLNIRDREISDILNKMKSKAEKIRTNIETVIRKAQFHESYRNTDHILLILVSNKLNKAIKKVAKKESIIVLEIDELPSGGVAYWTKGEW